MRSDGASYEIDGRIVPSRAAMRCANEWAARHGLPRRYDIDQYYDDVLTGGTETLDVVFGAKQYRSETGG